MKAQLVRTICSMLLLICACDGPSANACIDIAPFEIKDIRQADAIFSGKLVHYERVAASRSKSLNAYALLTIRVDKVIKGKVPQTVQLYWWNSTFGIPEAMEVETPLLIAAVDAKRRFLPLRVGSATVYPTRRPDLLQLMQAPCSSPFLLDDTVENVESVRMILRGETVGPHNYFAVRSAEITRHTQAQIEHKTQLKKVITALGGFTVIISVVALLVGWKRKRT